MESGTECRTSSRNVGTCLPYCAGGMETVLVKLCLVGRPQSLPLWAAVLTLVILGLQSEQFPKEDVSEVVHPRSTMISLDSGSLFESISEPTNAN